MVFLPVGGRTPAQLGMAADPIASTVKMSVPLRACEYVTVRVV
jgi:hypothetical protein